MMAEVSATCIRHASIIVDGRNELNAIVIDSYNGHEMFGAGSRVSFNLEE